MFQIRYIVVLLFLFPFCLTAQFPSPSLDTLNKQRLKTILSIETGAYIAGVSWLSFYWYNDKQRVPFHTYNDIHAYLQLDKAGHAYTAYHESYFMYDALRWSGLSRKKSLLLGGAAGLIFQTPLEVFDGLYEGWGFSWTDMIANAAGPILFTSQQALFDEQIVLMKISQNFFKTSAIGYNESSHWLSFNLKSLTQIREIPPWLNFAVGYGGENLKHDDGIGLADPSSYRQYYASFDVNFTKIPTNKVWLKSLFRALNFIKIPFPALEYNDENGFIFHPFYM